MTKQQHSKIGKNTAGFSQSNITGWSFFQQQSNLRWLVNLATKPKPNVIL